LKFTCDSCGKRFASVDEPFPGRVYKIRCGRCGHLVSVQAPVPWEEPSGPVQVEATRPEPEPPAGQETIPPPRHEIARIALVPAEQAWEASEEVSIDLALSDEYPLERRRQRRRVAALLALGGSAALGFSALWALRARRADVPPPISVALEPPVAAPRDVQPATGPLLPVPPRPPPAPPPAAVDPPAIGTPARPARRIVRASPPAPEPVPTRRAPAVTADATPAAPPTAHADPAPAAPPPARTDADERPLPVPGVAFERREAPLAVPRQGAPVPLPVDPDLAAAMLAKEDVAVRPIPADLTELRAILDGRRAVLEACFDGARGTSGAAAWAGRTPQLVVRVDPSGRAVGRVDDAALEPTPIASCLRRTVARITFPEFGGDPVELSVPVRLPPR
jgi:predicted Zn finger-like uncharacterized protein